MYWRNASIRDAQREILDSMGYSLVNRSFHEDWWVDTSVIHHGDYREYLSWQAL
jgi:hypothetical protein